VHSYDGRCAPSAVSRTATDGVITFAVAGLGTAIVPQAFTAQLAAPVRGAVHVLRVADPGLTLTISTYPRAATCRPQPAPSQRGSSPQKRVARPRADRKT
jgi:hypothetical protein